MHARFDQREGRRVEQLAGRRGRGGGNHEMVGGGEQVGQVGGELDAGNRVATGPPAQRPHSHVEREGATRHRRPDPPEPDEPEGPARELPQLVEVPPLRRLVEPDTRERLLERQHRAQHELRDRDRACAARARDGAAHEQVPRPRVETGRRDVHPADTELVEMVEDRMPEPRREQHLAVEAVGERGLEVLFGRDVDDLDVGHRVPCSRRGPFPHHVQDAQGQGSYAKMGLDQAAKGGPWRSTTSSSTPTTTTTSRATASPGTSSRSCVTARSTSRRARAVASS